MKRILVPTLRLRWLLFYFGTLAIGLGAGAMFLRASIIRSTDREAEEFLREKIHGISNLVSQGDSAHNLLEREIAYHISPLVYSQTFVRVIDLKSSKVLIQSSHDADLWLVLDNRQKRGLAPKPVKLVSRSGHVHLVHSVILNSKDGRNKKLDVALDLSRFLALVDQQLTALWGIFGFSFFIVFLIGLRFGTVLTAPVHQLAAEIQDLRASSLHVISVEEYPTELQPIVAALNELSRKLSEKIQSLSRFAENVAHEMRNPIQILLGEAEIALSKPRSTNEYSETLRSALEEYQELAQMIDSLLFIARAENRSEGLRIRRIQAKQFIDETVEFLEPIAESAQVSIHVTCPEDLFFNADESLSKRALSNLIVNAIHYAHSGLRIDVTGEVQNGKTVISVRDRGPGMSEDQARFVFERFYRIEPSKAEGRARGTGLGLAITKSIMELQNGRVTLELPKDGGALFSLEFT